MTVAIDDDDDDDHLSFHGKVPSTYMIRRTSSKSCGCLRDGGTVYLPVNNLGHCWG